MLPTGHLLAFALLSFMLIIVPGPNVLFVISRSLMLGRAAGVGTAAGGQIGVYLQVVAVAFGVGALVERSVAVFTVIKLAGAAYLVYLGVQAIRHRRSLRAALDVAAEPRGIGRILRDGIVVGVSNPKVIVFFAAVLPQFVNPSAGHVPEQMLLLGSVFLAIAVICDSRRLGEVRICVGKDLHFRPCPEIDARACRRDKVVMPPVRGGSAVLRR